MLFLSLLKIKYLIFIFDLDQLLCDLPQLWINPLCWRNAQYVDINNIMAQYARESR